MAEAASLCNTSRGVSAIARKSAAGTAKLITNVMSVCTF